MAHIMEGVNGMKRKIFLLLALPALLISSCHAPEKESEPINKSDYELVDEFLDNTEIRFGSDIDTTPLEISDSDPYASGYSKALYDFGPYLKSNSDLTFTIVDKYMKNEPPYAPNPSFQVTQDYVSFYDNHSQTYNFKSFSASLGRATLSISPSSLNRNKVYYLELKNDNLVFQGKDDDIRRLTFYTMDRGLTKGSEVHYKDDIVDLDSTKVYYYDEDGYSAFFVYEDDFTVEKSIIPGATIRLRNPDLTNDDIETVYGTFISISRNPNGAGYMVRYNPAKGADVFSNLAINDSKRIDDSDVVSYYNTEEVQNQIAQGILHNECMVTTIYGILNAFDIDAHELGRSTMDWGSRIDIKINTSYDTSSSAFTLSISASYTFYPEENITITLQFGWKRTWSYDVEASVGIETEFYIPVGIEYTLVVTEDIQNEVYFGISLSYNHAGEYDEAATEESINQAVKDAFDSRSDWQKQSVFKGDSGYTTPGGAAYPLFKLSCTTFLPIEIYFEVDFYWELIPTVEAVIKYSSHTQSVDLCVSNEGGADPSSDSATDTNKTLSFSLIGKVHFEAGFRLSLGVDIIGLYKFFHLEVYIKAYGAIDIQGFLFADISWNEDESVSANLNLGCKFEISAGLKIGIDLYLLFGGYNHEWPVVSVVLFGLQASFPFQEFVEETTDIYLGDGEYHEDSKEFDKTLGERHLLTARYFDSDNFTVDIKDLEFDDQVKAVYGAFLSEDVTFSIFSLGDITPVEGQVPDSFSVTQDGHFTMDTITGQDNFVVDVEIKTDKRVTLGKSISKTIRVHFTNDNRQEIFIDNEKMGSYVEGAVVRMPVPEPIKYKKFIGYKYRSPDPLVEDYNEIPYDEEHPENFTYTVETFEEIFKEVKMISMWIDYYHWEVYFMDGLNHMVDKQMVLNGEDAVEPSAEKRDLYMNQNPPDDNHHYEFVGYDREFTNITGPTVVRAIYRIVSN